jgi:general secretion pathway protein F
VWLILKVFQHDPKFQAARDRVVLGIPVVGGISREFAEAKFARAFGLLFENGVNVASAVEYAADACGNRTIRDALYPAGERLRTGEPIYMVLRQTGALSDKFNDLLTTGVQTGEIKSMLFQISDEYAAEAKHRSVQLAWYLSAAFFLVFCLVWAGTMLTPGAVRTSLPIPKPDKTTKLQLDSQPNNP